MNNCTLLFCRISYLKKCTLALCMLFIAASSFSQVGWVQLPSPDTSATRNMLRGISGTSSSDIWAVGTFEENLDVVPYTIEKDLIMHWNGSAWKIFPPMNLSTTLDDLWDVEAIATNNVWAAGTYNDVDSRAELLHFNGSAWSQYMLPSITGGSFLFSLDANSATDIWGVGGKAGSPTNPAYSIHYDGSSWTEKPVSPVGSYHNLFNAVDGLTANDVWAVGYHGEHRGDYHTLAMHWNGSAWSNFPLPAIIENDDAELLNVKMISTNDVWAVGSSLTGELLMVHWNGSIWSVAPHNGGGGAFAALAANNLYAVGAEISHWDGNAWTIVDPLTQLSYPALVTTKVFANGDIWAAGRTVDVNSNFHSLVYRSVNGNTPVFQRGAVQNWNAKANSVNNSIDTLLKTQYNVAAQTLTYSVVSAPTHGTLSGFPKTAITNNGFATPTGLTYKPLAGYSGTDQFIIKVSIGSASSQTTVNVSICATPTASIAAGGAVTFCMPGSVTLNATVSGGSIAYQWKKNGSSISGANSSSFIATTTGNYIVTVSNACGTASSNSITVNANSLPGTIVTPSGTVTICAGSSVTLAVSAATNQTYQWKKNNVNISGATKATYKASAKGSFSVFVSNTLTGCSASSLATTVKKTNCASKQTVSTIGNEKLQAVQSGFLIYPNPFSSEFFISSNETYDITISDLASRTLKVFTNVKNHTSFGAELGKGVYFLSIRRGKELIKTFKLIKQ